MDFLMGGPIFGEKKGEPEPGRTRTGRNRNRKEPEPEEPEPEGTGKNRNRTEPNRVLPEFWAPALSAARPSRI